jgi:hypothetical protein
MNKFLNIIRTILLPILFVSLTFVACEGPAGADGATGANGPQGPAGPAGPSGAEQCGVCHNNASSLFGKQVQWGESVHGMGEAFDEGYRTTCAGCHSSQGFNEIIKTGADTTKVGFFDAATINCRTCHKVHTKYNDSDWELTFTSPFALRDARTGEDKNVDLKTGNLCGKCHQARTTTPVLDLTTPDKEVTITSLRFGPHYGPMANVFSGKGAYQIPGSINYPSGNVHANIQKTCVSCHMADGSLPIISGHTMRMATEAEEGVTPTQKVAPCIPCHSEVKTKFNDKEGLYEELKADLKAIEDILIAKGWLDPVTHYFKATTAAPIKTTTLNAAAMYNYKIMSYDKSMGIHNPKYMKAFIKNTLEHLKK